MIRKITEKDIPRIKDVILEYLGSHSEYEQNVNGLEQTLKLAAKEKNSFLFVITDKDDNAVGYTNFHLINFPLISGKEIYISELFIAAEGRSQKLGTKLLDFVNEKAKELGCCRIMLNNSITSEAYKKEFYKKYGFIHRETMGNFVMSIN